MLRRGWFQLHLSTCVVLMFAAGALLCVNLQPDQIPVGHSLLRFVGPGWPVPTYDFFFDVGREDTIAPPRWWGPESSPRAVIIDIAVSLALLGIVAFLCEWLIRHRRPKP